MFASLDKDMMPLPFFNNYFRLKGRPGGYLPPS